MPAGGPLGQEGVNYFIYIARCRVRRLVQQVGEAGRQQQEKRDGREEQVERDPPGQKKNVVFPAIVPDAFGVVPKRPADPDMERPFRH